MSHRLYVCCPLKHRGTAKILVGQARFEGFTATSAVTDTDQSLPPQEIFKRDVALIKEADFFVAVLCDYGKDLAAECGMAFGMGKRMVGINYNVIETDLMICHMMPLIQIEDYGLWLRKWRWSL